MAEEYDFKDGLPKVAKPKFNGIVVWMLLLLPLGLIAGTVVGVYRYWNQEEILANRASKQINQQEVKQILNNYGSFFGDRDYATPDGRKALSLVAKNLAGELQSNNSSLLSYNDRGQYEAEGVQWKTFWADARGTNSDEVFFVVTSYDGRQGLRHSAKMALMITVAKSLAAANLDYTLRFVFVPVERSLGEQRAWVEKYCLKTSEENKGMFFLAHGKKVAADAVREDSWKVTDGDVSWAQEILKGTRVMNFGAAALHHGVLAEGVEYTEADVIRVESAAKGLRQLLFLVMGGDR